MHPEALKQAKEFGRKFGRYYKALRMDQRFAAPLLCEQLHALLDAHYDAYDLCYRPLQRHARELSWDPSWKPVPDSDLRIRELTSAHVAISDPTKIACYPTRADAQRGREVVMSPGKFFASIYAELTPADIQRLVEAYLHTQSPPPVFFIENDEYLSEDADELGDKWARIYASARGFSSCMVGFGTDKDAPVRFYALPNNGLSLAYMTHNGEPDGDVVARTICNLDKGAYVRVYGDARLAKALKTAPHNMRCDSEEALLGVRCRRISRGKSFLAPYIDGSVGIDDVNDSTCVLVHRDEATYSGDTTSGFAESGSTECNCCEDYFDEDDMYYSAYHDEWYCESCVDNEYARYVVYTPQRDTTVVHTENVVYIGDTAYLDDEDLLDRLGFVYIENAEEWTSREDAVYLNYLGGWAYFEEVFSLDVENSLGDLHALEEDTKVITLEGKELTVFKDYDGPTDEDKEEESDEIECVIERKLATV